MSKILKENMENNNSVIARKEILLNKISEAVNKKVDILDVLEQIANIQFKEDVKVKITVQQQDFNNGTNLTFEKLIL